MSDQKKSRSELSKEGWERRREKGTAKHSEETKAKISAGKGRNESGRRLVADRVARLEAVIRGFGYSDAEIRAM